MSESRLPVQRVTLITLGVADLERSRAFYADLGWQPVEQQEGVCFYQMDGMGLGLFGREATNSWKQSCVASAHGTWACVSYCVQFK